LCVKNAPANPAIVAEIEPVMGSARHANEVSGADLDADHGPVGRMDVKDAAALDDVADFVFVVPMLGFELGEHGVEVGGG